MSLSRSFWSGRRVLVTGHTGFKGAWLARVLCELGADVTGLALAPDPPGGAYEQMELDSRVRSVLADIRDRDALAAVVAEDRPEIVLHLAAQALVRASFADPVATFDVNVAGTAAVLEAATAAPSTRVVVAVTSDKVYANDGAGHAFVETDRLGGGDPYSVSKAAAELVVASWRHSFVGEDGPVLVTARAGNVIGGGDRAADRLLPDLFRSMDAGRPLVVRHPESVRPWQFVLDPVVGYLTYAEAAWNTPTVPPALNFGPDAASCWRVDAVVDRAIELAGGGAWERDHQGDGAREAAVLRLDAGLAHRAIGWEPVLDLDEALAWTVAWHRAEAACERVAVLADEQVSVYLDRVGS